MVISWPLFELLTGAPYYQWGGAWSGSRYTQQSQKTHCAVCNTIGVCVHAQACMCVCVNINISKTEILQVRTGEQQPANEQPITLQGQTLEEVQPFPYLGSEVDQSGKVKKEIAMRLEKAGRVYQMWRRKVFRSRNISITTKMCAFRTLAMSVLLYGAETWPVPQQDIRKLKTF